MYSVSGKRDQVDFQMSLPPVPFEDGVAGLDQEACGNVFSCLSYSDAPILATSHRPPSFLISTFLVLAEPVSVVIVTRVLNRFLPSCLSSLNVILAFDRISVAAVNVRESAFIAFSLNALNFSQYVFISADGMLRFRIPFQSPLNRQE